MQYLRVVDKSVIVLEKMFVLYFFIGIFKGVYYYYYVINRVYGGWVKVQFDVYFIYKNIGLYIDWYDYVVGGDIYLGDGVRYFNDMVVFLIVYYGMVNKFLLYIFFIDEWERYYVEGENDEIIVNVGIGYDFN